MSSADDPNDKDAKKASQPSGPQPLGDNAGVYIPREEPREKPADEDIHLDFGGFLVSLGTSCLVNLGRYEDPETGTTHVDLPAARQLIHILDMLQEKTRGNLSDEETQLLRSLLYDLRMAFVEASG